MIRAETRAALANAMRTPVEALGATLYQWGLFGPTVAATRVTIINSRIEGDLTIPVFEGSLPKRANDVFRFEIIARAEATLQTIAEAEQLVQNLASAAMQAIHADPSLGGLTKSAGTAGTWRLATCVVIRIEGPELDMFEDGCVGYCSIIVECSARIYP